MIMTKELAKSSSEIEGIIFEAEKAIRKVRKPEDDFAAMISDANRHREHGLYNLEKLVGKIVIGPNCTPETLGSLNKSNLTPHTILQEITW